jgi:tRNA A-37 threonylcarbamoyl transferase component Bud32
VTTTGQDPHIGRQVGDYRVVSKLGEGGMGMVYKGQHAALGQIVAIKSLHSALMNNQSAKERFIREAQALARVTHPNIISLLNFINNDTGCFIVMEFAEGEDLEAKLQKMGIIPPEQCLPWFVEACRGLSFAHKQGIIHRDIKPSNIIVHPSGRTKLLDFGTAKLVDAKRLTQQGMTLGTIVYMSKEQLLGKPLDARSDLYSLGVTLYECVTGQLPFYDEEERKLVVKIAKTEPIPPSQHYPAISKELEAVILKSMAKEPEGRFQNADEMEQALMRLLGPAAASLAGSSASLGPRPAAIGTPVEAAPAPLTATAASGKNAPVAAPAMAPVMQGAPPPSLLLSPLVLVGLVLGIIGVGAGVPVALLGPSQTVKIIGVVVLLVLGLIGGLLCVVGFLQWSAAVRLHAMGGVPAPFQPPTANVQPQASVVPASLTPVAPVPQPVAFAPGGTLNVNSANAAQNYPAQGAAPPAPPRPPAGTAVLQVIDGPDKGRQYQITRQVPLTIGRAPTCGATLNDPGVSGTHAQVIFEGQALVVMDMGSRNGVFVNNAKINQRQVVTTGDLVVIGSTRMSVSV